MILLLRLFYEYFKVGLFAVGGGMATIPFLEALGTKTGWFTHEELLNHIEQLFMGKPAGLPMKSCSI